MSGFRGLRRETPADLIRLKFISSGKTLPRGDGRCEDLWLLTLLDYAARTARDVLLT